MNMEKLTETRKLIERYEKLQKFPTIDECALVSYNDRSGETYTFELSAREAFNIISQLRAQIKAELEEM